MFVNHSSFIALRAVVCGLSIAALTACSDENDAELVEEILAVFSEHPCTIPIPQGFTEQDVRCGTLEVPREREQPSTDTVLVEFGVILARQQDTSLDDPFVYIPGGPGDQSLDSFFAFDALDLLKNINQTRDLVYFDPRGTGISSPSLSCPERLANANAAFFQPGGAAQDRDALLAGMRACYERLVESGIALSGYSSVSIAADLADGLRALGYSQVNLWGTSYGGRIAQVMMRDYPEMVRSVVLDASTMPDIRLSESARFQRSVDRLFENCAASPTCNDAFPDLETKFYGIVDNLNAQPVEVTVNFEGQNRDLFVSGDRLLAGFRNALNSNGLIPLIPLAITTISDGDFAIVNAIAPSLISSFDTIAWGHFASVECSENAPYFSDSDQQADNAGVNPLIVAALDPIGESVDIGQCEFWDVESRPAIASEPIISDIPALILQGEYDTAVPTAYAERANQNLSSSQYVLFPGFGHVVLPQDFNEEGTSCGQQIVSQFLMDPEAQLDRSCIDSLAPPF